MSSPSDLDLRRGAPAGGIISRSKTRWNLAGASLPRVRRDLARARQMILALQIKEAFGAVDRIELQLGDFPPAVAKRFRSATELLRGVGLALQDDSLSALAIAMSCLWEKGSSQDRHAASTLCRFGFWQLGKFDSFCSLPRHQLHGRSSKWRSISAMFNLSIEAAVALDHLHISTAKRLALDALEIAERGLQAGSGLAALPASVTAQVLYEEGSLDEADEMLRDRLAAINSEGSAECALRAYMVLARIARHRTQNDFAALLLREAETLGNSRGWSRLVAASLAERTSLLLHEGRMEEARDSVERLERYAEAHRGRSGNSTSEVARYQALARWRVSWAEAPSGEAAAALRQLYHHAVESGNFYAGCRLAVELAQMLAALGESAEADALFFDTLKSGAVTGLYQVFLDGGTGLGILLRNAYDRADGSGSTDRQLLPYLGSLLARWDARNAKRPSAKPSSRRGDGLTLRERDILAMISQGFSNKRIAQTIKISPETVKSHVKRIFLKLGVSSRAEAVSRAGIFNLI
jgi:ATP/maltotriose-dependent transcriptional regulator MalT